MVRKDLLESGQVRTVADLKGRKLASFGGAGGAAAYQITRALRDEGLSVQDVELLNLSLPDTIVAFKNGAIDGANLPEPFSTEAAKSGLAVELPGGIKSGPLAVAVIFGGAFSREQPEAARRCWSALCGPHVNCAGRATSRPTIWPF